MACYYVIFYTIYQQPKRHNIMILPDVALHNTCMYCAWQTYLQWSTSGYPYTSCISTYLYMACFIFMYIYHILLSTGSINWRRRYISKLLFHWIEPYLGINRKLVQVSAFQINATNWMCCDVIFINEQNIDRYFNLDVLIQESGANWSLLKQRLHHITVTFIM